MKDKFIGIVICVLTFFIIVATVVRNVNCVGVTKFSAYSNVDNTFVNHWNYGGGGSGRDWAGNLIHRVNPSRFSGTAGGAGAGNGGGGSFSAAGPSEYSSTTPYSSAPSSSPYSSQLSQSQHYQSPFIVVPPPELVGIPAKAKATATVSVLGNGKGYQWQQHLPVDSETTTTTTTETPNWPKGGRVRRRKVRRRKTTTTAASTTISTTEIPITTTLKIPSTTTTTHKPKLKLKKTPAPSSPKTTTTTAEPVKHFRAHQSQFFTNDDYEDGIYNYVLKRSPKISTIRAYADRTIPPFPTSSSQSTTPIPIRRIRPTLAPGQAPIGTTTKVMPNLRHVINNELRKTHPILHFKKNLSNSTTGNRTTGIATAVSSFDPTTSEEEDSNNGPPIWRVTRIETSMKYSDSIPNINEMEIKPFANGNNNKAGHEGGGGTGAGGTGGIGLADFREDEFASFKKGQPIILKGTPQYIDLQSDESYNPFANGTPPIISNSEFTSAADLHSIFHPIFNTDTDLAQPDHKLPENKTMNINNTLNNNVRQPTPIEIEVKKNKVKFKKKHPLIWNQDSRISSDEGNNGKIPGIGVDEVYYYNDDSDYTSTAEKFDDEHGHRGGFGAELFNTHKEKMPMKEYTTIIRKPTTPVTTTTIPPSTTSKPLITRTTLIRVTTPTLRRITTPITTETPSRSTSSSSKIPPIRTSQLGTFSTTTARPVTTRRNPATTTVFYPPTTQATIRTTLPPRKPPIYLTTATTSATTPKPITSTTTPKPPSTSTTPAPVLFSQAPTPIPTFLPTNFGSNIVASSTLSPLDSATSSLNELVQLLNILGGQTEAPVDNSAHSHSSAGTLGSNGNINLNQNQNFGGSSDLVSQLSLLESLLGGGGSSLQTQTQNPLYFPAATNPFFLNPVPTNPTTTPTITTPSTTTTPRPTTTTTSPSTTSTVVPNFTGLRTNALSNDEIKSLVQLLGGDINIAAGGTNSQIQQTPPANNIQDIVNQLTTNALTTTSTPAPQVQRPNLPQSAPPPATTPSITAALQNMIQVLANPFGNQAATNSPPAVIAQQPQLPVTSAPSSSSGLTDNVLTQLLQLGNSLDPNMQNTRQVTPTFAPAPPPPVTLAPMLNPFSWLSNLAGAVANPPPTTASPLSSLFDLNSLFRGNSQPQQQQQQQQQQQTNFLQPLGLGTSSATSTSNPFSNLFNFNFLQQTTTTRRPLTNGPYYWLDVNTFFGGAPDGIRPKLGTREHFIKVR